MAIIKTPILNGAGKIVDGNLPDRLGAVELSATYLPRAEIIPTSLDGGNATSTYTGTFNFDGGSAA